MKSSLKTVVIVLASLGGLLVLVALISPLIVRSGMLSGGDVRRVNAPNADLIAAIKKAQSGLPDFIRQLQSPKPGTRFAVERGFETDNGKEYLWLKDPTYDGRKFTATLDQSPMTAKVKKGDRISFDRSEVVDWLIQESDGTSFGRYTDQALSGGH
jgi:uncharacterized protein YegJ (DUF2314 family)